MSSNGEESCSEGESSDLSASGTASPDNISVELNHGESRFTSTTSLNLSREELTESDQKVFRRIVKQELHNANENLKTFIEARLSNLSMKDLECLSRGQENDDLKETMPSTKPKTCVIAENVPASGRPTQGKGLPMQVSSVTAGNEDETSQLRKALKELEKVQNEKKILERRCYSMGDALQQSNKELAKARSIITREKCIRNEAESTNSELLRELSRANAQIASMESERTDLRAELQANDIVFTTMEMW